jgi:hypothetical protein
MKISYNKVKSMYAEKGWKFYDSGAFNVNLFGIRNGYDVVDEFNDILGIAYVDDFGNEVVVTHKGTTKPGLYYLKNKLGGNNGTAILIPGYYSKCWKIGEHKGYQALVQNGMPFKVWRDNNSDGKFDIGGTVYTDVTGLNRHTTSFLTEKTKVGPYSAGCQVDQDDEDHLVDMAICSKSARLYGNSFSYALFDEMS